MGENLNTGMNADMEKNETIDLYRNNNEMIVDAFDRIVVNLFRERQTHNFRSFMICSCNAGVGSTSITMELAISLAVSGWRTVLIDCDLRKENRYKRLNQKVKFGLSDYIIQPLDPSEILYPTNWPGLHYIACGHHEGETPVKLLCSQRMGELTALLKQEYDFVLFDVPALNSAADATIVGAKADCTFLAASSGETTFHDLETAKKQLEDAGANILGVILNKVTLDDYRYYMQDYNYFSDKEYLKRSAYYRKEMPEEKPKRGAIIANFFKRLLGCLTLACALALSGAPDAQATQAGGTASASTAVPVVTIESYSIDGEIAPEEEFTLNCRVKNLDTTKEVRQLKVNFHAASGGVYLADGETNQCYVERLRPGETTECSFALKAAAGISGEVAAFEMSFAYESDAGAGTNTTMISPSVSKNCRVDVISLVTSERAVMGAKALFSMQYENSGTAELDSLTMRIRGNVVTNNEEIELKIPAPGQQAVVEDSIVFTDVGSQELYVYLTYTDKDGRRHEMEPKRVVTDVVTYDGNLDVYGTDIVNGEENKHLVKRETFSSVLQKVQTDYAGAIWVATALLILDCLRRLMGEMNVAGLAKRGKKQ